MKTISIYDPAMCCATGVCGPAIDPELIRVATAIEALNGTGAQIIRYNLASEPQAFISNTLVNKLLMEDHAILPITLVNGQVVKTKEYLTNQEFEEYTGILLKDAYARPKVMACCCNTDGGCC